MYASIPVNKEKVPFFVMINFRDNVPDLYMPTEEIIDSGYAVLSFCYNDVTTDDDDFTNGLAGVLYENGERVKEITTTFPYWFCKNYYKYSEKEYEMPFEQHYLVASIFPRRVYITSATGDIWPRPRSEFLTAVKVSEYYEKNGLPALKHKGRLPEAGEVYHDGYIGYHLREGLHYMGRYDWQKAIEYINKCKD